MTTGYTGSTTGTDQFTRSVTELPFSIENAVRPHDDACAAFRAVIAVVRRLRNQRDEYASRIDSLKAERSELYRLIDALCAENGDWRVRAYPKQMAP